MHYVIFLCPKYIDKVYSLLMGFRGFFFFNLRISLKHVHFTLHVPNVFYNE